MKSRRERFVGGEQQTGSELVSSPGAFDDDDIQEIVEETFDQFYDSKSALDTLGSARRVVNAVAANETRRQEIVEDEFIRTHFIGNNERAQVTLIAAEAGLDFEDINTYDGLFDVESNRQAIADAGAVTLIRQVESLRKVVPKYVDFETDLPWEVVDVHATGGDELECFYFEPTGEFVVSHRFLTTGESEIEFESIGNQEAIDVMAVGGGGSGTGNSNNPNGISGAGAGGLVDTTRTGGGNISVEEDTYSITVGAGGTMGNNDGNDGNTSSFDNQLTADGGASPSSNSNTNGNTGGSGSGGNSTGTNSNEGGQNNMNDYGFGSHGGSATAADASNAETGGGGGGALTAGRPSATQTQGSGGDGMYVGHYYPSIGERGYVAGGGSGVAGGTSSSNNAVADSAQVSGSDSGRSSGFGGIGGGGDAVPSGYLDSNGQPNTDESIDNYEEFYNLGYSLTGSQPGLDGAGGGGASLWDTQSINPNGGGGDGQVVIRLAAPAGVAQDIPVDPKHLAHVQGRKTSDLPRDWDEWKEQYA